MKLVRLFFSLVFGCVITFGHAAQNDSVSLPEEIEESLAMFYGSFLQEDSCLSQQWVGRTDEELIQERLLKIPAVFPMTYNRYVSQAIHLYYSRKRVLVSQSLALLQYYRPIFEKAFDKTELPYELFYLAIVESALNPAIVSKSGGTVGLWQFTTQTGRAMGLEINSLVDERMDPLKSTEAATRLLRQLYGLYQDWPMALAAYNCGTGTMAKAIVRSGGKKDVWQLFPFLPYHTRNYLPLFIATSYMMHYHQEYGICPARYSYPSQIDTVHVSFRISFDTLAAVTGVDLSVLTQLNPQFKKQIIPGHIRPYAISLPLSGALKWAAVDSVRFGELKKTSDSGFASKQTNDLQQKNISLPLHIVKKGDTLSGIAKKYRTTVRQLQIWNNLKSDRLSIGQKLKVTG